MKQASLQPVDVSIAAYIFLRPKGWSQDDLAYELGVPKSTIHRSLKRLIASRLYRKNDQEINTVSFYEFLIYGIHIVFPAMRSKLSIGVPTAHSASPITEEILRPEDYYPIVWPLPLEGTERGEGLIPLLDDGTVKKIASSEKLASLYRFMAVVDTLRVGNAREKEIAKNHLKEMLEIQ